MHQRDVEMAAEHLDDLVGLAQPQQPGIDKDAGELLADRLMQQNRRDRGVDPARQAANDAPAPDPRADALDRLLAKRRHGPIASAASDVVGEVAQQRRAVRRVHHLRMELHAVEASCVIGDDRERRAFGHRDGAEARRQRGDPIAVAHPHRLPAAFSPHAVEQRTVAGHLDDGAAELAGGAGLDPATQLFDHRLLPVADAENREARQQRRWARGVCVSATDAGPPDRITARGANRG